MSNTVDEIIETFDGFIEPPIVLRKCFDQTINFLPKKMIKISPKRSAKVPIINKRREIYVFFSSSSIIGFSVDVVVTRVVVCGLDVVTPEVPFVVVRIVVVVLVVLEIKFISFLKTANDVAIRLTPITKIAKFANREYNNRLKRIQKINSKKSQRKLKFLKTLPILKILSLLYLKNLIHDRPKNRSSLRKQPSK